MTTLPTIWSRASLVSLAMPTPSATCLTEFSISSAVSRAALARASGQIAHLLGHHREAASVLAGARRLDRGVEREQVGLEGDLVDDLDDLGDVLRRGVDLVHRRGHRAHLGLAVVGRLRGAR